MHREDCTLGIILEVGIHLLRRSTDTALSKRIGDGGGLLRRISWFRGIDLALSRQVLLGMHALELFRSRDWLRAEGFILELQHVVELPAITMTLLAIDKCLTRLA